MSYNNTKQTIEVTSTQSLEAMGLQDQSGFAIQWNAEVTTPSAMVFTSFDDELAQLTSVAHGMVLGLKVQVSSATTLPTGLSAATDYFVVPVDANNFNLATSLANALAGTVIEITDTGTGEHTVTPTALAGGVIKIQESVDGTNWYDISGATANITATAKALIQGVSKCGQIRPYLTMTAGQLSLEIKSNLK